MSVELKIPEVGESIREVLIGRWLHEEGDSVEADEDLVELETDKASMELPPKAGVLAKILKREGESVNVGEVVGYLEERGQAEAPAAEEPQQRQSEQEEASDDEQRESQERVEPEEPSSDNGARSGKTPERGEQAERPSRSDAASKPGSKTPVTPSARRAMREHGLSEEDIIVSGPRIRHEDVLKSIDKARESPARQEKNKPPKKRPEPAESTPQQHAPREELVPMSLIRRRIAERLVGAQQQAALLTTFNEIDMSAVKRLRSTHGERFREKHGIKLGFLSFFVKAVVDALKDTPELNAEVRGDQIAYRNYRHIGVAISSDKGLVVPVLRHAERLGFAGIERAIDDFATRARNNKLSPDELVDGTFTISNGGVFGSLLSTPIVNPPQSGVLGMHAIEDRPVARDGQVVIRPMMYVALTYDHRIVDGREAVTFLRRIKETIEEPARMLLDV